MTKSNNSHWDNETIDYYVRYNDLNGWASTSMRIYEYVLDHCEQDNEEDFQSLYSDLLNQVFEREWD